MLILRVTGNESGFQNHADFVALRKSGVSGEVVESGREAFDYLRLYDYDLVLLDLDLPDMAGDEVIRKMRAEGLMTPVVVLTSRAMPWEKVAALDHGADDIIVTPCDKEELLARLRAVLRRSHGHARSVLCSGPVELSLDRRQVHVNGERLHLTRREFAVLELLFLRQGTTLNKAAFLNHLYCGTEEPEMKSIDVTICRVRKKLAEAGVPDLIDTVRGYGHMIRAATAETKAAARVPAHAVPTLAGAASYPRMGGLLPHAAGQEAVAA